MIIKAIDSTLVKYRSNFSLVLNDDFNHTWVLRTTNRTTQGKTMPYSLTLDWNIVYKEKDTGKKIITCDSRFYMEFDVEIESKDRTDLAAYLETVFSQAQGFIKINSPQYYDLLAPLKPDFEGLANHYMWDIVQFGCYKGGQA